jgi:hypothetical protein
VTACDAAEITAHLENCVPLWLRTSAPENLDVTTADNSSDSISQEN